MLLKSALLALSIALVLTAEPVTVRYVEGSEHGFLSLHTLDGKLLASGDLTQVARGGRVTSHVVFHFKDGSLDDETAVFSQHGTFRLISDRHLQKGPAFLKPADVLIDAASNKVTVHYDDNGVAKVETEQMDLPNDLANGVIFDIVKNLVPDAKETRLSWIAATPKPRLVKVSITPNGVERFYIAGMRHNAARYKVKVEIGGLAGLIAPLVGKEPADMSVWITTGPVPAFVKLEGPLFLYGPLWRMELSSPVWPAR